MDSQKKDPLYKSFGYAGQYRSRSGGRSGDGRAEATCKDCKRYSSRCGSDCSNYGSDRRDYYFSAKGTYIPWVLKQIEIVKGDRRYGKFRRWS